MSEIVASHATHTHTQGHARRTKSLGWTLLGILITGLMLAAAFGIIGTGAAVCAALFPLVLLLSSFRSETALFSCLNLFPLLLTLALSVRR